MTHIRCNIQIKNCVITNMYRKFLLEIILKYTLDIYVYLSRIVLYFSRGIDLSHVLFILIIVHFYMFFQNVDKILICPICRDIKCDIILNCNHQYCNECLEE